MSCNGYSAGISLRNAVLAVLGVTLLAAAPTAVSLPADETYFAAVAARDVPLPRPRPGEWRYEHTEPGQTLVQYQGLAPVRPTSGCKTIYLWAWGSFSPEQRTALADAQEYLSAFFQQPVVLLDSTSVRPAPATARRRRRGHEQVLAPYLLDTHLRGHLPPDGLALMAFTTQDLYPRSDWEYVFGVASYADRVGITSLYRLQQGATYPQFLRRLLILSSHEIGHMFSLRHCIRARCAMNGTNHLAETDATPNRLCAECQRKLHWYAGYDNRQRLQQLAAFFRRHQLTDDYRLAKRDMRQLRQR